MNVCILRRSGSRRNQSKKFITKPAVLDLAETKFKPLTLLPFFIFDEYYKFYKLEKEDKKGIDFLTEWAVWGNLSSQKDLESILLKGHLYIEVVLEVVLKRNELKISDNFSFYRKISEFKKLKFIDDGKSKLITSLLEEINMLRNKLAHEFQFDINGGEFDRLAQKIFENLEGTKFSNYTRKTRIVQSFSILTKNLLELS